MGYNHFRYARKIDADNIGIYHNDLTQLLKLDKGTANAIKLYGGTASGDDLYIYANSTDTTPVIQLAGASFLGFNLAANQPTRIKEAGTTIWQFGDEAGHYSLHFKETTTPTAFANYGALYTKNDNKLYFQTGAGVEKEVQFV